MIALAAMTVDSAIAFLAQRELVNATAAAANDAATQALSDSAFYTGNRVELSPSGVESIAVARASTLGRPIPPPRPGRAGGGGGRRRPPAVRGGCGSRRRPVSTSCSARPCPVEWTGDGAGPVRGLAPPVGGSMLKELERAWN